MGSDDLLSERQGFSMDVWVNEIKCLMCGHLAGYRIARAGAISAVLAARNGEPLRRCPRCSGPLYLDPSYERPRDLGIDESTLFPREDRPEPPKRGLERRCIGCGAPVQRAQRCRRCYLRHRYATNPLVRAKQLALQAAWRKRHMAATNRGASGAEGAG